ncbi:uncharacterized protein BuS5_03542 [Desulfosarcina sp. BuS5]|uniref:sulfite exporter TauE/SafE family protein n=1 Tax=Desulfosarcina sp. BuS5 TaxID=933262 RepID=UPI0005564EF8|nr:sulfite exporter TauE/SafE family protein [Desulfosarcina sp. BuS5]WDN90571.1 uncharacterized protein BuS5_03542 [Desulfosarcina sp. BuS5]
MVNTPVIIIVGVIIGLCAAFSGLGGGFMIVPLLIFFGYSAQKAVGTSFLGVLIISISAFLAHIKLSNVDYKVGLLLGAGGIIGAQAGARLVEYVPTIYFKKIFALILICLALYFFLKK